MANNNISNDFFAVQSNAVRLPNSPRGLNVFKDFTRLRCCRRSIQRPRNLSSLDERGVNDDEARTSISRYAVYQAVILSSAPSPRLRKMKIRIDFLVSA
jgi:hypothetical protein